MGDSDNAPLVAVLIPTLYGRLEIRKQSLDQILVLLVAREVLGVAVEVEVSTVVAGEIEQLQFDVLVPVHSQGRVVERDQGRERFVAVRIEYPM